MNIEQLQLINRNQTTTVLLKLFSTMEQKSDETNLESFFNHLTKKGNNINKVEYHCFFKDLERMEINNIPIGYTAPNGVFKWNYSFKDVSEQILFPNKMVNIRLLNDQEVEVMSKTEKNMIEAHDLVINVQTKENNMAPKKGRGRPKGSRNKSNGEQSPSRPVERAKEEIVPKMLTNNVGKEVIFMFTNSKGRTLPFNLEDAEKLLEQVKDIKQHLG